MSFEKITYVGHSSVLVKLNNITVAIDPWLEGNPLCPENLINPGHIDLIVLTHGHSDHAGDTLRLAKAYNSNVACIYELGLILISEGIDQSNVILMNKGGEVNFKGVKIALTNAFHSSSFESSTGTVYAGEACGVILGDGQRYMYHAGDTSYFSDMNVIREQYHPFISLLPIGDVFTMNPFEAARAAKLIGSEINVPIHYNTFDLLTGTAEQFEESCRQFDIEALVLEPGQELTL